METSKPSLDMRSVVCCTCIANPLAGELSTIAVSVTHRSGFTNKVRLAYFKKYDSKMFVPIVHLLKPAQKLQRTPSSIAENRSKRMATRVGWYARDGTRKALLNVAARKRTCLAGL